MGKAKCQLREAMPTPHTNTHSLHLGPQKERQSTEHTPQVAIGPRRMRDT